MDEREIRELVEDVRTGRLSRRAFVATMVGLGLTAPLVARMLAAAGVADAQPRTDPFAPTRRGGGGQLKTLWWQAPTLLNPHFANGTKDQDASRIFYEPLAGFDPEGNFLNAPSRFSSRTTRWEFSLEKANQVLDAAGWRRAADGTRVKDGKRLKMVYQTSINASRQKTQQIVKQAATKAGIDLELKSVVASVFFSSDPANPDTFPHFYADLQMYNTTMAAPDPQYFMNQFASGEVASKANKWQGAERHALAPRGVRPRVPGGRFGARPREARRALRQAERPRDPGRRGHPGSVAQRRVGVRHPTHGPLGLGLDAVAPGPLA
jgi:ABC-type transport system substrate-binding protein